MSGIIYHLFCLDTGKAYVGQTWQTFSARLSRHLQAVRRGCKLPIHSAIRKYGEARFVKTILTTDITNQEDLDSAEIYWGTYFDCLAPGGYNLKLGHARGKVSDEARANHSAAAKLWMNKPGMKEKRGAAISRGMRNPEINFRHRERVRSIHARPEVKQRFKAAMKIAQSNPEVNARRSASIKKTKMNKRLGIGTVLEGLLP